MWHTVTEAEASSCCRHQTRSSSLRAPLSTLPWEPPQQPVCCQWPRNSPPVIPVEGASLSVMTHLTLSWAPCREAAVGAQVAMFLSSSKEPWCHCPDTALPGSACCPWLPELGGAGRSRAALAHLGREDFVVDSGLLWLGVFWNRYVRIYRVLWGSICPK